MEQAKEAKAQQSELLAELATSQEKAAAKKSSRAKA
jgi:hypothetical protein